MFCCASSLLCTYRIDLLVECKAQVQRFGILVGEAGSDVTIHRCSQVTCVLQMFLYKHVLYGSGPHSIIGDKGFTRQGEGKHHFVLQTVS